MLYLNFMFLNVLIDYTCKDSTNLRRQMWFIVRRAHLPGVNQTADVTHDIHLVHSIAAYQTPLALNLVEGGRDSDEEGE